MSVPHSVNDRSPEGSGPVYVTRPVLPPLAELIPLLEQIWDRRILTNCGPLHGELEQGLAAELGLPHVSVVANGMLALECAMVAAGVWGQGGEVITTPYSFVATAHAIRRAGLTPVFVDIRPDDLNIDADQVAAAITPRTRAIVPVHCYGNPCDDGKLQALADAHGLKLIYDAAHAFGVRVDGRSLLAAGDFAGVSFHATKVFNSFEGGAVVSRTAEGRREVELARNFGIADEVTVLSAGVNAKMSELHAAVGLLQLARVRQAIADRGAIDRRYRAALAGVPGIHPLPIPPGVEPNHGYFPVLVGDDYPLGRDALYEALKRREIYSRRYFYPLLANLPMYADLPSAARERLPVANDAAERVLCLPIYPDLSVEEQDRVIDILRRPTA